MSAVDVSGSEWNSEVVKWEDDGALVLADGVGGRRVHVQPSEQAQPASAQASREVGYKCPSAHYSQVSRIPSRKNHKIIYLKPNL